MQTRPSSLIYRGHIFNSKAITHMKNIPLIIVSCLALLALAVHPLRAADWLQQGGPDRNGIVPDKVAGKLTSEFKDLQIPLLWKATVGLGSAPVVVSDGKIYTFGLYKPGTDPAKLSDPASMPTYWELAKPIKLHDVPGTPDWVIKELNNYPDDLYQGNEYALNLDAHTGKLLWTTKLSDWGMAYRSNQLCGDIASPAISDGKLVFHSATGHLYCLNLDDGKKLWEVNLWEHEMYNWAEKKANGCSPLIINGTVIISYVGLSDARWKEVLAGKPRSDWTSSNAGPLLVLSGFAFTV